MAWKNTTPIIPNTTMEIYTNRQGIDTAYKITPNENYLLHNKARDKIQVDNEGNRITVQSFTSAPTTCSINYDFTQTEIMLDSGESVTIYGEKEYYTVADKIIS